MPEVRYYFEEFAEQMGCEYVPFRGGYLFENGAQSNGRFEHRQPPRDPERLLKLQIEFTKHKIKVAEKKFKSTRNYIDTQTQIFRSGYGPAVEEEAFKALEVQQRVVFDLREKMLNQRTKLKEMIGPPPTDIHAEEASQRKAEAHDDQQRLAQIRI